MATAATLEAPQIHEAAGKFAARAVSRPHVDAAVEEDSYLCGPRALQRILAHSGSAKASPDALLQATAPVGGLTLIELQVLSAKAGMELQIARRNDSGAEIPLPAVLHWKIGHYSAVVGKTANGYWLDDPAYGDGLIWASAEGLARDGSGYFLLPQDLPWGWSAVPADEASQVIGGQAYGDGLPGDDSPIQMAKNPECKIPLPGSEPQGCRIGMAQWDVALMMVNLRVSDTPLGYRPPVGPEIHFNLQYNQREANQPAAINYANFGPLWNCDWIGSLTFDSTTAYFNRGQGGIERFKGFSAATQSYQANYEFSRKLVKISATRYDLQDWDGSKLVFAKPDNASAPTRIFMTQVVDPQGNAATIAYDASFRVTGITDAIGQTSTFIYGAGAQSKLIKRITDPFGRFATFDYDGSGRLIKITDVIGMTSEFTYDGANKMQTLVTGYGTTSFAYGTVFGNRFVEVTHPNGDKERVEQRASSTPGIPASDPPATVPKMTGLSQLTGYVNDQLDKRNVFYWDRKTMKESAGDYTRARIYHFMLTLNGPQSPILESYKVPGENRVWLSYWGQTVGSNVANEGMVGIAPSTVARVLDDGTTQEFHTSYNSQGNPVVVTDPSGRQVWNGYASNGVDLIDVRRMTKKDDWESRVRLFSATYDAKHRPLTVTDAAGKTTTYTWNARGQLLTAKNALNETTTFNYNAKGYLISINLPLPGMADSVIFTYDAFGRVRAVTGMDGYVMTHDYDALNRVTKVTYPDSTFEETTWQLLHASSTRDRMGRITSYTYDSLRQLESVTDPLNRVTRYEWCKCGGLKALIDGLGQRTSWKHDVASRVTGKVYADGSSETYEYDTAGRVSSITDAKGQKKVFTYDVSNHVTGISYLNALIPTPSVAMTYDPWFDRLVSRTDGSGVTSFTYHPIDIVPSVGAGQLATVDGPLPNDTITYAYDALGRVLTRSIGGVGQSQVYDELSRVTNVSNVLGSFNYGYDGSTGRPVQIDIPGGWQTQYEYFNNAADRRLKEIRHFRPDATPLSKHAYTYDAHGRLLTWNQQNDSGPATLFSLGHDAADRLTSFHASGQTFGYTYDEADNRLTETINGLTTTATYNPLNELTLLDSPAPLQERTYEWDAEDRLVAINYTGTTQRTEMQYDGIDRCVRIIEKNGATVTSDKRYVWCGYARCEERDSNGATALRRFLPQGEQISGQSLFYFRDHLGSVRDVGDWTTLRARYSYDPWGRRTKSSGDVDTMMGFTGHFTHEPTGMALAMLRAYEPDSGRWLSRDPLGERTGSNLFVYGYSDPSGFIDLLGAKPNNCTTAKREVEDPLKDKRPMTVTVMNPFTGSTVTVSKERGGDDGRVITIQTPWGDTGSYGKVDGKNVEQNGPSSNHPSPFDFSAPPPVPAYHPTDADRAYNDAMRSRLDLEQNLRDIVDRSVNSVRDSCRSSKAGGKK